jgi:hypothetical protein
MGHGSLRDGTARDMTQLVRRCRSIASGNVSSEGLRRVGRAELCPVQPDCGKSLETVGWTHPNGPRNGPAEQPPRARHSTDGGDDQAGGGWKMEGLCPAGRAVGSSGERRSGAASVSRRKSPRATQ